MRDRHDKKDVIHVAGRLWYTLPSACFHLSTVTLSSSLAPPLTSCIAMTLKAMTLPFGFKLEHALWLCDRP